MKPRRTPDRGQATGEARSAGARSVEALDEARALHAAGVHDLAEQQYRAILARSPGSAEAMRLLGLLLHQTGRGTDALPLLTRAAGLRPGDAATQDTLGLVLKAAGDVEAAIEAFTRAVTLSPGVFGPLYNLGNALHAAGRTAEAVLAYRRAVRADPSQPWGWNNLADAYVALAQPADAVPCYRAATRMLPGSAEFHFNLGQAHRHAGDWTRAALAFDSAAARAPDNAMMAHHCGLAKQQLRDHEGAVAAFGRAAALQPGDAGLMMNLGLALQMCARFDDAERLMRDVLALRPYDPVTLDNLGQLLSDTGQMDEAEHLHRRALELAPEYEGARYNLSMTLLAQGRLREGFAEYHSRWSVFGWQRRFTEPAWDGEPFGDQTLLVHDDQGVGDFIQFCRLVPLAAARGRVLLQVPRSLRRLMTSLKGAHIAVHPDSAADAPAFDRHCAVLDLPHALRLDWDTLPPAPYLSVEPTLVGAWRERLAALPGRLRVGLTWAGNADYFNDRGRSLPFAALDPLASLDGVTFVSLQKGGAPWTQRERGGILPLQDWSDELHDYADTAALTAALDLVISVDTSVAHLAGAIGAPIWLLNRLDTDWRWLHRGDTTAWYASMRIFRQTAPRDWAPVVQQVCAALAEFG